MATGLYIYPMVYQGQPVFTSDNSTASNGSPVLSPNLILKEKDVESTLNSAMDIDESQVFSNRNNNNNRFFTTSHSYANFHNPFNSFYSESMGNGGGNSSSESCDSGVGSCSSGHTTPTHTTPTHSQSYSKSHLNSPNQSNSSKKIPKTPIKRFIDNYGSIFSVEGSNIPIEHNINKKSFSIGSKKENDLILASNYRKTYALLSVYQEQVVLENLTRYSIKINNLEMLTPHQVLLDGDHIKIKNTVLIYRARNSDKNNFTTKEHFINTNINHQNNNNNKYAENQPPSQNSSQNSSQNIPPKVQLSPRLHANTNLYNPLPKTQKPATTSQNPPTPTPVLNNNADKQLVTSDYIFSTNITINLDSKQNITDYKSYIQYKNIGKPIPLFKDLHFHILRSSIPNLPEIIERYGGNVVSSHSTTHTIRIYPENTIFDFMRHKQFFFNQPPITDKWVTESIKNNAILPFANFSNKCSNTKKGSIFNKKKFSIYPNVDINSICNSLIDTIRPYYNGTIESQCNQLKEDFEKEIIHLGGELVPYESLNISGTRCCHILVLGNMPHCDIVKLNIYKLVTIKWIIDCKEGGKYLNPYANSDYHKNYIMLNSK